jgi:Domain of unknown function (DU1801)
MAKLNNYFSYFMHQAIKAFISTQPSFRQDILSELHRIILENDPTVAAEIDFMMGKEMIMYKGRGMMKYALASVKDYMSLHVLPMYMSKDIFEKYKALLPKTKFQKGCINFEGAEVFPLQVAQQLIIECSPIDLVAIREAQLKERKSKSKNKGAA